MAFFRHDHVIDQRNFDEVPTFDKSASEKPVVIRWLSIAAGMIMSYDVGRGICFAKKPDDISWMHEASVGRTPKQHLESDKFFGGRKRQYPKLFLAVRHTRPNESGDRCWIEQRDS